MGRLALVIALAAARTAAADGIYFTERIGGAKVTNDLAAYTEGGPQFAVALGMRADRWALEGFMGALIDDSFGDPERRQHVHGLAIYGLDLKYINPIADHFELYLRGRMSAAMAQQGLQGWEGRGLGAGAGIQLKGKVRALGFLWAPLFFTGIGPKVTGALYLDTGYDFYRLHGPRPTAIDAEITSVTVGWVIGSDF